MDFGRFLEDLRAGEAKLSICELFSEIALPELLDKLQNQMRNLRTPASTKSISFFLSSGYL
jgi:hypothetical protein